MSKRDPILRLFGQNVARHRRAKELSQEALADRTYLSDIEGGTRNPGLKNVVRIAKGLGIATAELCKGVDA